MFGRGPVFLQTGFRTGGTWLWSRFRANVESLCFCEPLNEALEAITPSIIEDLRSETSNLRHPTLASPYFREFFSLLNDSGVGIKGYRAEFGLNSYFATSEEPPIGMAEYLQSLTDLAIGQGRRPVLKFTRALARAGWLKTCFPGACQVALFRNLWAQFSSALSLASDHDNFTFLMIPLFAISRPEQGPLKHLCDRLRIPSVPFSSGIDICASTYTDLARRMPVSDLFSAFLGMLIVSHARSYQSFDLVVVQDMLASNLSYQQHAEARIQEMTGLTVDLSGCRNIGSLDRSDKPGFNVSVACKLVYDILRPEYSESIEYMQQLVL